ncbi:EAL domain-containing protein [Neosynechococcus sphagnicola]|uniref:EAL domain-containing protein n=1 Tax=Neosynechococcus sphagnicola TaxID=1501145 RepID=UPI001EF9E572|nr:EAL domain-containing protein [Neosynechococcus sphagnicola]
MTFPWKLNRDGAKMLLPDLPRILTEPFASQQEALKLVIYPDTPTTNHAFLQLGFQAIPEAEQLLYLEVTDGLVTPVFLQISQVIPEISLLSSRFSLTRSPLTPQTLLLEFLKAQPLSQVTQPAKFSWFVQLLTQQQLFFVYQPIFHLATGEIFGHECLARAFDDQGHHCNGQQLINAALSTNLAYEFDSLARTTCLESIAHLQTSQVFFINILPNAILCHPQSLANNYQQVLDLGLQPSQIVFELTEVEILTRSPELLCLIHQIQERGFQIAVDDLCASVTVDHYFMDFLPNIIKLDRRLVQGCYHHPVKQVLIKSLLNSAHELSVRVVAEGLEMVEDIQFCQDLGVDYGQGFGLAVPQLTPQVIPSPAPALVGSGSAWN